MKAGTTFEYAIDQAADCVRKSSDPASPVGWDQALAEADHWIRIAEVIDEHDNAFGAGE